MTSPILVSLVVQSPLGRLRLFATDTALVGLYLPRPSRGCRSGPHSANSIGRAEQPDTEPAVRRAATPIAAALDRVSHGLSPCGTACTELAPCSPPGSYEAVPRAAHLGKGLYDRHVKAGMVDHGRVPSLFARGAMGHPVLEQTRVQLDEYFSGVRTAFDLPIAPEGTAFQRAVWAGLRTIPFGQTRSYASLAAQVGYPGAARAVGAANARNPVGIIVPCHRVIGADGSLTGFAAGLAQKRWLLDHERAA
jgi:methylated-DNA-[protein]-cysteine S-methyltransferase